MKKSMIDQQICEQVKLCGKEHIIFRYSVMRTELQQTINEMRDLKRASVLSDVLNIINDIIDGVEKPGATE